MGLRYYGAMTQSQILAKSIASAPSIDEIRAIVRRALDEDVGDGDVTTNSTVAPDARLRGEFIAKQAGVVAGLEVARLVLALLDEHQAFSQRVSDGERVAHGQVLATVEGPGRALLSGERTALNLLQRMSGIATLTRQFVDAVGGTRAIILDTRKTAPGLRVLDKWAVRLGGGQNHRFGLYDMALIKDNHIAAVGGSLAEAIRRVRAGDPRQRPIEVEVTKQDELRQALEIMPAVDRILLDNMSPDEMRAAVEVVNGRVPLEASGNVSLETVAQVAATGVDYISIGALTHSVRALDISLELTRVDGR
jgi:nicotinate-nucleotide pyrophosphorylase (carboxylating)